MPLFQNGIDYLRDQLMEHAYSDIKIYREGELICECRAVVARSVIEDTAQKQKRVNSYVVDFIVRGDIEYRPIQNDRIEYNGKIYPIRPVHKVLWQYDDPYQKLIRIHTREEFGAG